MLELGLELEWLLTEPEWLLVEGVGEVEGNSNVMEEGRTNV